MMASTSPFSRKPADVRQGRLVFWLSRCLGLLAVLLGLCVAPACAANDPEIRYAELVPGEEGYVLNADIVMELNPRLEDVITRGVPLYFVTECVVTKPRWYWLDETIVERRITYRISYHAVTRKFRLSTGSLGQSFDTLGEAVRTMLRVRNWNITERDHLRGGESYNVAVRFRLDTNQLPKPFQVTAIGSREWNLASPWMNWTFLAAAAERR